MNSNEQMKQSEMQNQINQQSTKQDEDLINLILPIKGIKGDVTPSNMDSDTVTAFLLH